MHNIYNKTSTNHQNKTVKIFEINVEAIARLPQVETNTDLDRPPSEEEVKKAIKQLSTGKAPYTDAIPAEVYKHHRGDTLLQKLTDLFCRMWDEEVISQQLKDASIVHLYQKGNRQLCDNYGGISLQAIAGKILARVLLNRLIVHLEHGLLPESQCFFRGGRGTVDMIFAMATEVGLQNRWRSVQPQTTQSKDKGDGSHTERTPL